MKKLRVMLSMLLVVVMAFQFSAFAFAATPKDDMADVMANQKPSGYPNLIVSYKEWFTGTNNYYFTMNVPSGYALKSLCFDCKVYTPGAGKRSFWSIYIRKQGSSDSAWKLVAECGTENEDAEIVYAVKSFMSAGTYEFVVHYDGGNVSSTDQSTVTVFIWAPD